MTLKIRKVVTGHDANGKAVVQIDETASNFESHRAGVSSAVIWTTEGFPVDNSGTDDNARTKVPTARPNGTVFRVIEFAPGVTPRNHRTDTVDYAVVLSGEIDMPMDDTVVHLKAGDVLVQRGTIYNWVNNGTEPCVIAFVLVAADPVSVGGRVLEAKG